MHALSVGRVRNRVSTGSHLTPTALAHGLTLATRNTRHFTDLPGLRLENWIDTPPAGNVAPPL